MLQKINVFLHLQEKKIAMKNIFWILLNSDDAYSTDIAQYSDFKTRNSLTMYG